MFELIAFLITLIIPGYLLVEKHFFGLEKWVLSVFLSLSVTSFFYYFMISFFSITKEIIYFYALILLIVFFVLKKPNFKFILISIKKIKFDSLPIQRDNLPNLFVLFILVLTLSIIAFSIPLNKFVAYDDSSYHLPIIFDIADNGQKTFFVETYNIYQVRSNQFPLLFESFVGTTKFLLKNDFFWFISFFSLVLSLFLIFFISKQMGYFEFFSFVLYGLTPVVLVFSRYFGVESFLSLFFLGAVFFVLQFIKTEKLFFVFVSGFLAGLMFLVKFTGGIFFVGLFLFLLYKRKFKASFLFGLVFVLVSLVFVVSHLTVPFEQVSVGGYGSFSNNLFIQIPSNIIKIGEIFFNFFSYNFYIFFIPLLFSLGLFWKKNQEKNFSVLFFISLILFLGIIFLNQAHPTFTGFPRYFLPVYSLLCIFSGIQLKKIISLKDKRIPVFLMSLFVLFILFTSVYVLVNYDIKFSKNKSSYSEKKIENKVNTKVWFVNGAALQLKLDKAILYDYVWKADFSGAPCEFLKNNGINYIVYFHIDKNPIELGAFGVELRKSLLNRDCSEVFAETHGSLNSVTYKIIQK